METDRLLAADPASGADVLLRASCARLAVPENRPSRTPARPGETPVAAQ
ncbi:hypothetical protein [Nocardia sp. X0981]